ncbi:MAG TPA: prepilin-type N-terminal cleavage/methylation domain-containing protein [Euryarchaeota archaeon]|nr:prepilin-type N-terminal cleavage/methylation domain-containing protein [Euryarchaeota archaeon]
MFKNTKKGFTLIELLVVISIIGLLSSVILASLNTARSKARDAQRISDLKQIQLALELYRDENGSYPVGPDVYNGVLLYYYNNWNTLSTVLTGYIPKVPQDPIGSAQGIPPASASSYSGLSYTYYSSSDGSAYQLMGRLENSNSIDCATNNYIATVHYAFFGPLLGNSFCDASYGNGNNDTLYVISS